VIGIHLRVLEFLKTADQKILLFLNGKHNSFLDFIMYWASNRFVWIPFYAFLLAAVVRTFGKRTFFILILVAAMITVSDQVASGLVKNAVHRLRPCHNPEISSQVHLVNGYCGGSYGYFSSHASNAWALAGFLVLIFRREALRQSQPAGFYSRMLPALLFAYALLLSYSRVYLGAHYPADVLTGIAFGSLLSFIFANIFFRFQNSQRNRHS
jgi:undecaprenyl-diphosphatase